jgi:hypothetical protein
MTSTRTVSLQNSAPRAGVVKGISYTIGDDAPWTVPIIPDSDNNNTPPPRAIHLKAPSNNNNKITKTNKHSNDNMQVQVPDHGPQTTRQNRLPIFNQVRNMLNKSTANTRSDETSSEHMSDMAVKQSAEPRVKPSRWDSVFNARPNTPSLKSLKSKKSQSNISVLRDPETNSMASGQSSPTSLYSSQSGSPTRAPSQVSVNAVSQLPRGVTAKNQFKRKPVQSPSVPATENSQNIPPPQQNLLTVPDSKPRNRLSLSHAALSDFTKRQSSDSSATGCGRPPLMSHFSWTTIGTSAAPTPMEEIEDPFPTALPPMPSQQPERSRSTTQPPAESILSRKRPVQRVENQEWAPSTPRQRATTGASATSGASDDSTPRATPHARNFSINDETPRKPSRAPTSGAATPTQSSSGKKALPLLPFMLSEQEASHVEQLLSQERNLVMQRRNIERAIADLEQVEFASPLEVSFATVRDAKRKLEQHRETLQEVKMEEMDVGIKIARARRREDFGEGEGSLWVRRVTG